MRSALRERSGVRDRTHKDSLEVIKLSLLRNLTPKPVQETERIKREAHAISQRFQQRSRTK